MRKTTLIALILSAALMLVLAACGGQQTTPEQAAPTSQEEHQEDEDDQHDEAAEDDHDGDDAHDVSESDAIQKNPIETTDESIAEGSRIYAENCAVCHGDTGLGDGVAGASLNPPPANLHKDHVQVLSDGGLFAIIHNGVENTAMPAFGETLDEDDIWHVVNFIRTYREN